MEIHQRLLSGDPSASLDAAELLLYPSSTGCAANGREQYVDACRDAATEVMVIYLGAPDRYDPRRSALLTWLTMQAHGDLLNDYKSPQKKFERSWLVESALSPDDPEPDTSVRLGDRVPWLDAVPSLDASAALLTIRDAFPDERDRRLIWLTCVEQRHSTDDAAAVLGLMELPQGERAAAVKRNKDRVMRRLRRLRLDRNDE